MSLQRRWRNEKDTAIEKIAAPFCEKIICISDAEKQSALEKNICRGDKLQVIFNGVDIEAYECGEHIFWTTPSKAEKGLLGTPYLRCLSL